MGTQNLKKLEVFPRNFMVVHNNIFGSFGFNVILIEPLSPRAQIIVTSHHQPYECCSFELQHEDTLRRDITAHPAHRLD